MALGKIEEAAAELEQAFLRAAPSSRNKRMSEETWVKSLKKFHGEAREIRRRFSLGLFGRAKAAYLLQKRLIEAGIGADAARKVVFSLVLNSLSGK